MLPEQASGDVAAIYDELRATLRVPLVNKLFRTLAAEPAWLRCAWDAIAPAAGARAFEAAASDVRARAAVPGVDLDDAVRAAAGEDLEAIRAYTETIRYVLPKLLLIATAWDPARETAATCDLGSALPRGPAEDSLRAPMVDPAAAREPARTLLREIPRAHGHPGPATYYRGLANWPAFMQAAWRRLEPLAADPARAAVRDAVVARAAKHTAALGLPGSGDCEVSDPERLADLLAAFRLRLVPDVLVDATTIAALLDGPAAAGVSRLAVA